MNFKEIIDLTENDSGKIFVVDEHGNVKSVILSFKEYRKKVLGRLKEDIIHPDTEAVNREILKAQLAEPSEPAPLGPVLSRRAQELFKSRPASVFSQPDLRAEVIDPNFDFEAPRQDLEDI